MDQPSLPPVVAGRSALPAFVSIEVWARQQTAAADAAAEAHLTEAHAQAERIRVDGEAALRDAVQQAERDALRTVQDRAQDRVSEARHAVQRWVEQAEATVEEVLEASLDRICGG